MRIALVGLITGLLLAVPAHADAPPGTPSTAVEPSSNPSSAPNLTTSPATPGPTAPTASEPASLLPIPFQYTFHGFIRGGYTYVPYNAAISQFIGHDSGFRLYNTRLEFSGAFGKWVDFVISVDSMSTIDPTTGLAPIQVGFEDAYTTVHWGPAYLRVGQFKTPFNGEFLLDDEYIPFVTRSMVTEGMAVDQSNTPEPGILLDRQIGAMLGDRIGLGENLGLGLIFAAVNGNGANEAVNDNTKVALVGRVSVGTPHYSVAVSGYWNDRTNGTLATREDERDLAADLDFLLNFQGFHFGSAGAGLKIFGMVTYRHTEFLTVPQNEPINSTGGVLSASLPIELSHIVIEPALRYVYFQPDSTLRTPSETSADSTTPFQVSDYTIGLNLSPRVVPLRFQINYTYRSAAPIWEQPNSLLEIVLQAQF